MKQLSIYRIGEEAAVELSAIASVTFEDTFTGTCSEDDMKGFLSSFFNVDRLKKLLSDPDEFFYFITVDGVIAGYMRFKENYDDFPEIKQWKALELKNLYVDKKFHGSGIARSLMDFYLEYAAAERYQVAWLGVWEHNVRAQKFYAKFGFKSSGYTHDFPIGNTPQTDQWWWKFI